MRAFTVFGHGQVSEGIHKVRQLTVDGKLLHQVFLGSPAEGEMPVTVGLKRNRMPVIHSGDTIFEASRLTFIIGSDPPRGKLLLTSPNPKDAGSIVLIEDVKQLDELTSESQLVAFGRDALVTMVPGQSVIFTTLAGERFELSQLYDNAEPVCRPVFGLEADQSAASSQVAAAAVS